MDKLRHTEFMQFALRLQNQEKAQPGLELTVSNASNPAQKWVRTSEILRC